MLTILEFGDSKHYNLGLPGSLNTIVIVVVIGGCKNENQTKRIYSCYPNALLLYTCSIGFFK